MNKDALPEEYNMMNDLVFKFVFGKEARKHITIDFLNAVLAKYLGHEIEDLTFMQTEKSSNRKDGRSTRLDVVCQLNTGETVNIEMQVADQGNMKKRSLFYWGRMYADSLPKNANFDKLRPAIMVNIVNFSFLSKQSPHSIYRFREEDTNELYNQDIVVHFLEVPKLLKGKSVKEMNRVEKWLAYFSKRYSLKEKEEVAMSEAAIKEAVDATKLFMADAKARYAYYNREKAIRDWNQSIATSRRKGREEGKARLQNLIRKLIAAKRFDDVAQVTDDEKLAALYAEFGI